MCKNTQSSPTNLVYKDPTYILIAVANYLHPGKSTKMPNQPSTRKINKMSNQQSTREFLRKMRAFKARHPKITVKPPRNQKPRKVLDKTLNKKFWKSKAKAKIVNMSIELHQKIENNQYTNWTVFREHLQKLFNNKEMNIRISMI